MQTLLHQEAPYGGKKNKKTDEEAAATARRRMPWNRLRASTQRTTSTEGGSTRQEGTGTSSEKKLRENSEPVLEEFTLQRRAR